MRLNLRTAPRLAVGVGLAVVVALAASLAVSPSDAAEPFASFDTKGLNAVALALTVDGNPSPIRLLVREHGVATVSVVEGRALLFEVEEIADRGDAVRLALYEATDARKAEPSADRWVQDLELSTGAPVADAGGAAARAGARSLQVELLSVRLANR